MPKRPCAHRAYGNAYPRACAHCDYRVNPNAHANLYSNAYPHAYAYSCAN